MPRKKKEETVTDPGMNVFDHYGDVPPQVDGVATEPVATSSKTSAPPADTITIRLDANGRIDVAAMRPKTTQKLTAALEATPDLFAKPVSADSVPDYLVALPHQLIASLEISFAARQLPAEIAQQIFQYTDKDHEVLAGPTKAVLAEYLPMLGKHQNLAALVGALFIVHSAKIAHMRSYLATATAPKAA